MRDAVGTAALAALATFAFSAAVVSHPTPALGDAAQGAGPAHPAWGADYLVPAAPAVWVWREVYDADGNPLGRERVNLIG